ncbi:pyrimidine reductase family protein [Cumulibacter manganitolerans]|uniref:pyrimidine reductase family protein n=1 Tax=Cumulibacter manganitolerans TaxID=1884992 RepID=UPI001E3CEF72|nr:pyrimidine reductase family protein [Cumulibacter manganitolerans]
MRLVHPAYDGRPQLADVLAFPPREQPAARAWVRAVFVASLDGAATLHGRAGGLGNDADRRLFALHRSLADVVLVGAGTVRVEGYGPAEQDAEWAELRRGRPAAPPIAVVSQHLDLDPRAPLLSGAPADARTIVITCEAAPAGRRAELASVADVIVAGGEQVDLAAAVQALAARGLSRITCEGGPTLLAHLSAAGTLDELCLTLSPVLLAGRALRITDGPILQPPLALALRSVLEDDGYLFLQYTAA